MKSITVNLESDKDAEMLMGLIQSAKFEKAVEAFEEEEEFTEEDIAEFDRRMAEYDKDPSTAIPVDDFMKQMKQKYGI
jgi:putative addiction module component (TIGR02574 family)